MTTIENGRHEAFEVSKQVTLPGMMYPRLIIGTLWDKAEAGKLAAMIDGYGMTSRIRHIGLVVVDGLAYYETTRDGLPVELVRNTAKEAEGLHQYTLAGELPALGYAPGEGTKLMSVNTADIVHPVEVV